MDEPVETGLTVTVTSANASAKLPIGLPPDFSVAVAASLARDLSIGLYDRSVVLRKHEISEAQCLLLENHPYFQNLLEQAAKEWNAPTNIKDRLALEASVGLEKALPSIVSRMQNQHEPLTGVVQAAKTLSEIAGVGGNKTPQAPGEKFTITINLGADKQVFEKTLTIDAAPDPGTLSGHTPLQSVPEGAGVHPQVSTNVEVPRGSTKVPNVS